MTIGLLLTGCSSAKEAPKEEAQKTGTVKSETTAPKTEANKSETAASETEVSETERNTVKTDAFSYANKVDITDARGITNHVTATVFMSDELTQGLATQHVLNQSYEFLQQADLKGVDTVTIGVMKGDIRVFQYKVTMKDFVPNDSDKMSDVVLKSSKVEKMAPQVEKHAKIMGWAIKK
ncbi:hypothetical protein N4T77_02755 [Clostridium sp. CX1]|uniref:hypothetical protein n=1 Tax=Clostridium sp. CX1 TaxID=2978346 RepID=UPI0021C0E889|nr:hypothetical protein [Clostridium sp. CX1]MCT8975511.1 hypothetical protein [Clostridium sp. CX1]